MSVAENGSSTAKSSKKAKGSRFSGEEVYNAIREMAIEYHFAPGETIRETRLATHLNVSRTPVREALNRLVTEGLITFQKNRGFFCRTIGADELLYLAEARLGLELMSVNLAIERATDAQLRTISDFWIDADANAAKSSSAKMARKDEKFHDMIAKASQNTVIRNFLNNISARIRYVRRLEVEKKVRVGADFKHHFLIAEALINRDNKKAEEEIVTHLKFSNKDAVEVLSIGVGSLIARKAQY
ncbi:MAG: GntR family transcriptional regulator [Paracoccaceae bacterium]|jgi:DNA-binding GntR family transcriptional regulator